MTIDTEMTTIEYEQFKRWLDERFIEELTDDENARIGNHVVRRGKQIYIQALMPSLDRLDDIDPTDIEEFEVIRLHHLEIHDGMVAETRMVFFRPDKRADMGYMRRIIDQFREERYGRA